MQYFPYYMCNENSIVVLLLLFYFQNINHLPKNVYVSFEMV